MNYQPLPHWTQSARELRAEYADQRAAQHEAEGNALTASAWRAHAKALRTPVFMSTVDFVERRHG